MSDEIAEIVKIVYYPNCSVLIFADGHMEAIELEGIEYIAGQGELN